MADPKIVIGTRKASRTRRAKGASKAGVTLTRSGAGKASQQGAKADTQAPRATVEGAAGGLGTQGTPAKAGSGGRAEGWWSRLMPKASDSVGTGATSSGETPRGIRLCHVFVAALAVLCVVQAAVMNDNLFVYDTSMLRAIVFMAVSARSLWLLHARAMGSRPYIVAGTFLTLALSMLDMIWGAYAEISGTMGGFLAGTLVVIELLCYVAMIGYLAFSPEAIAYFDVPLDTRPTDVTGHTWDTPFAERVRTWPFWRDLAIYFIVFSILGHWAEILFCRLIIAGVFMGDYDPTNAMLWDQWLYPFSAEGIALAMVVLILHPLKLRLERHFEGQTWKALGLSFLINLAVCTSIDFGTGMVANQHYELWDYRDLPFNFMGQVCLQNSMVYSIAATLIVWWVYPLMDRALRRMPRYMADGLFFGLAGIYAFLAALHFFGPGA